MNSNLSNTEGPVIGSTPVGMTFVDASLSDVQREQDPNYFDSLSLNQEQEKSVQNLFSAKTTL
jgi:hypothetical protein